MAFLAPAGSCLCFPRALSHVWNHHKDLHGLWCVVTASPRDSASSRTICPCLWPMKEAQDLHSTLSHSAQPFHASATADIPQTCLQATRYFVPRATLACYPWGSMCTVHGHLSKPAPLPGSLPQDSHHLPQNPFKASLPCAPHQPLPVLSAQSSISQRAWSLVCLPQIHQQCPPSRLLLSYSIAFCALTMES